jgi:hypothetical protein
MAQGEPSTCCTLARVCVCARARARVWACVGVCAHLARKEDVHRLAAGDARHERRSVLAVAHVLYLRVRLVYSKYLRIATQCTCRFRISHRKPGKATNNALTCCSYELDWGARAYLCVHLVQHEVGTDELGESLPVHPLCHVELKHLRESIVRVLIHLLRLARGEAHFDLHRPEPSELQQYVALPSISSGSGVTDVRWAWSAAYAFERHAGLVGKCTV